MRKVIIPFSRLLTLLIPYLLYGISSRYPAHIFIGVGVFLIGCSVYYFKYYIKSNIAIINLILYFIYSLVIIIGVLFDGNVSYSINHFFYINFYLFPLILLGIILQNRNKNFYNDLVLSYLSLTVILIIAYFTGYIDDVRYQHVGNITAASIALLYWDNRIGKKKYILIAIFIYAIFIIGSRQSLLAIIVLHVFLLVKNTNIIYKTTLIAGLYLLMYYISANTYSLYLLSIEYDLNTITRFLSQLEFESYGGGRFVIYDTYIDKMSITPNFINYNLNLTNNLPHNFFIEIGYVAGLVYLSLFILIHVLSFIKKSIKNNIYATPCFYLMLVYFVPLNVSSGLAAAKYFIFFYFLFLSIQTKNEQQKFNNTKL